MIQHFKRYFSIRSYVMRLSQDLVRRFKLRPHYSVEHVRQAVQRGGFSEEFIVYAHAAFCSQEDFEAHYKLLGVSDSYEDLRRTIAQRYLSGRSDFNAEVIIARFRRDEYTGCSGSDTGGAA